MKTQSLISSCFARAFLFTVIAGWVSTAPAQTTFPPSSAVSPLTVIAGDSTLLWVSGLNTSTSLPPTTIEFYSEDITRVLASSPVTQRTFTDPATSNMYYESTVVGGVAGIQRVLGAVPDPIPVVLQATMGGALFWEDIAYFDVLDPTCMFSPASPAVKVSDTIPISIRRSMARSSSLSMTVYSANGSVLGLGTSPGVMYTNAFVNITFAPNEPTKTIYASARALTQGVTSTNIVLTAEVGSYRTTLSVLVVPNGTLILTPQTANTAAGDSLAMTVTRTTTNTSPLEVLISTDDPLKLSVPQTVVIAAGEQTANFIVIGRAQGAATVHVTAVGVEDNTNSYSVVTVNNPTLVYSQNPVTNTVGGARNITINRPYNEAGGDLEISFVSLEPTYFRVEPAMTIIPAGYISVTATVYGLSTGTGFLQASVGSFKTNLTVIVTDPSLTFSPGSVSSVVGDRRTVTVTRPSDENAIALTLNLSSLAPGVFSLSGNSVTIPEGQQSATFEVTGLSVGSGTLAAYIGAYSTNIAVTVGAPTINFLPAAVTNTVGDVRVVTLSRPLSEASADLSLSLASLAPDVFSLSASSVLIPAGSISATVTVTGVSSGAGFLQARSGSYATNLPVTINDPTITFSPTPTMTNTVGDARILTISRAPGESGADLSLRLSSLSPDVFSLSAGSVTILAGNISATVTVFGVTAGTGFIEARVGSYATNLAVQVNSPVLTFTPVPLTNTVGDARTVSITRSLTQAGSSLSVSLASLSPGVFRLSSGSAVIPTGYASATVTVYGLTSGSGFLEARVGAYSTNLSVIVKDPTLNFLPSPLTNTVGDAKTLTVSRPVGEAGSSLTIALSSLAPDLFSVNPSSITIPAGDISVDVTVYGLGEGSGILQANAGSYGTNLAVIVGNPTLTFTPDPLTNRVGEIRTVTVRRPVSQSGASLTIQLSTLSVDTFALSASQVTIAAGQVSIDFLVLGLSSGSGTINASVSSYSTNLQVIVPPTTLALSGPAAVRVDQAGTMTITRGGDSPSSKLTVDLEGSDFGEFLEVPVDVTIQAGQTSATFDVIGLAQTTGVEVRATAVGYPSASVMVPVIPTNPLLQYIVWRDVDASKTYNAGDTVTLTFNSSMATSTVTTANLTLKELNTSYAWITSPTGSWGAGSTVTLLDPGAYSKYQITLAGVPVLSAGLAVDPSNAVTDVLGYPDTTVPPVYLPGTEADTNTNGIPDWWEELHFGCAACVNANVDPDGDGLVNLWEFKLNADPLDAYSLDAADLVKDGDWDSDGDTLVNRLEIDQYGTDPSAADTDDDGWTDGEELDTSLLKTDWWRGRRITSPLHSRSPLIQRSMLMTGVPVAIPDEAYLNRAEWMVDLWVRLTNSTSTGNLVCRETAAGLTNFCLRVDNNVPTIEFQSPGGVRYGVSGVAIPVNLWTHLTGAWIPTYKSLELKQNDVTFQAQNLATLCAQGGGSATIGDTGLFGYLDKVVIRNPLPVDVVFVLDISGSMGGDRIVALKEAATMAVDLLPQDTPIGIVAFSDDATNLTQGFTTDKIRLKRIISSLVVKNLTDYTKALDCATNLVATSSTLDRHLEIFISDGEPNPVESSPSDEKILASANMGIVIDTIGFQLFNPTELQRLSSLTDGKYFDAPTSEDLQSAFAEILNGFFKVRYLFDDGGVTAEDYERPLNWSNALSSIAFETNTYVETPDIDLGDTVPPQWWQTLFFGVNGCDIAADTDKDGLINLYEYYCDTNPRDDDTDGDGVLDGAEDYDGDGLQNQDEQAHASDPRLTDTDDDGMSDLSEKTNDTDAAYSLSPYFPRVLRFGGTTNDYLTMPFDSRFKLMSWTLEAWVNPASGWGGNGSVIYRDSEAGQTNFFLGLNGSLQPVAGFGAHMVMGGTPVTADSVTWTHLAATYDSSAQKLTLYVNGTQVVVKGCSENPRASGIGPVVQRIGQSFNGMLDEVRIWNVSRSPESIVSELHRTLSGNDPGLVAYYRFDDNTRWVASPLIGTSGNNITNGASAIDPAIHPWTWGQVEDFATAYSKKDWTNRWKNAATINGNVSYSNAPGVTVQYPAVRVILQPLSAVGGGAQWSLNGGNWYDSGDVAALTDTNTLSASLGYRGIYGWTEPSPEVVQLTNGMTRTLVRYYQMNGTFTAYLEPAEARSNGAMWRLDGGAWWPSEMVMSNVSPGSHLLDFTTINGWQEPPLETITLSEGETKTVTRFFSSARGSLIVNIEPPEARLAGAQWSVDDGGWQDSGVTNSLSPGTHNVSFRDLAEWTTPSSQQVAVIKSQTNVMNVTYQYGVRSVSGMIFNESLWNNRPPRSSPPGDGSGSGRIMVGAWLTSTEAYGSPLYQSVLATNILPAFGSNYAYSINYMEPQPTYLGYQVRAWVDADFNGRYDIGEPASAVQSFSFVGDNVGGINVTIEDDLDNDSLPEWWEAHWFGNIGQTGSGDFDRDGLSNLTEYNLANGASGLASLNPADFDSDGDGMDDRWEVYYYVAGAGLNPTNDDAFADADGDGLSNIQEYNGVDGLPRIEQDMGQAWGIASSNATSDDAINPLDIDTDGDDLVDSFEGTWYDVAHGIDPTNAVAPAGMLRTVIVKANGAVVTNTTTLAGADPDQDGLTHYREQCLLVEFREGGSNDIWSTGASALPVASTNGVRAFSPPLLLGATNAPTIAGDLVVLRGQEWTSPDVEDTDGDLLPDGWETEYNLDPKSAVGVNGFWGDPDGDNLLNEQEYLGQDGNRSTDRPYVNGTGDETSPNEHNWRPDSTGPGPGVMRPTIAADYWYNNDASPTNGTLGAALPTISLGADDGLDTDDDGIPDDVEIQMEYLALGIDPSPVHSMSPFIKRAALIRNDSGIEIPDPEGAVGNYSPLLHKRDWTVECYVKLLATNMTGYLVDNPGPFGLGGISYRLSLTNNTPVITFSTLAAGVYYKVVGPALPTGKWIHLAGSWDHANNSLDLYVDGVFVQDTRIFEDGLSGRLYGSQTPVVIGASADGTFSNRLLMDEVRIWGVARSGDQIEQYRTKLVPQNSTGLLAYYRFDDGGATAEDFARKAKNGLFASASDDYLYGDFGYALRTNSFSFITNDYAMVLGVDARGADDTDGDGMPDDWEMVNHLNPLSTNSLDGAWGDADGDSLVNIYEFWSDTNPHDWDTDQDGVLDVNEDRDGDGVVNLTEQQLGSRPDLVDTDDDSLTDNEERGMGSNPADATDPAISRAVELDGSPSDYLDVPISIRQRMLDWTLEAWVNPANVTDGVGTVVRRVVQNLGGGANAMNFILGVETNASGSLQAYAGYVLEDGSRYMIHGGDLPTGTWTHVAAVCSSASLTIYTNGYYAASVSGLSNAPPINGKGGDTFVRIGEDFRGRIDELRVWSIARTVTQIRTNYTKTVSESQTNLVHYFRFDDGQATTNVVAFNLFHQPHGAQDFTYARDWTEEWKHAAMFHGNSRFVEPGGVVPPPSLRLNLLPSSAISDGAQWSLDGGGFNNSGVTLNNLTPGSHTILYKSIYDWTAPSNEVVVLTNGTATTLSRTYLQNGTLTIGLEPLGAVSAGAQWRVDAGTWQDSGITLSNLSPAVHSVEFKPVSGWAEPVSELVTIGEGDHISFTRTYSESLAFLQVMLVPTGAIMGGAAWNVNGGGWYDSGTNIALSSGPTTVGYRAVPAWIGPSNETVNLIANTTTILTRVYVQNTTTDTDSDGLLDAWEVMWFGNLAQTGEGDPDRDGLSNLEEFRASMIYTNLAMINPLHFDTDVDGMDDKWEYDRYLRGVGLSPCSNDAMHDFDGDGLMNVQEYNGMDDRPRLEQDVAAAAGIAASNQVSSDAINPLDIDTDNDGLVDSFEAAWYDPAFAINPISGVASASVTHITVVVPGGTNYTIDTTLAGSDPDVDGLTDYREQCLLAEFSQGGALDIWSHGTNSLPQADANGARVFAVPLLLGATNSTTIGGDIAALRGQEWTDPADVDTDVDGLPDGWEIEFNLNPRSAAGANGRNGDPDGDTLLNTQEYLGQDGLRATNAPYINGTGDETSPNEHNWRPDSTDVGPGLKRPAITNNYWYNNAASPTSGTLGAARPTTSLGVDNGLDTDDDGIPDNVELQQEYVDLGIDPSPVHSMSPFIKRSMLITRAAGVGIPDPEGAAFNWRALLHKSDFTIECYVKLLGTNLTGYLVDNPGPLGVGDVTWRLGLTNNVPYVSFNTVGLYYYKVLGSMLPTNRWIHLAGAWSAGNNSLSLYVDGIFVEEQRIVEPAMSGYLYPSASQPTIGSSANGSFSNRLMMDEIRIWGVSRTAAQIEQYRTQLVPQNSSGLLAYYRFDDGGTTAEDFARKAQNSLFTAVSRDYTFGDFGYALRTNGFQFVTNDYAMVLGVDARGADDMDGDGMPDDWEMVNHLDPLSTNGLNGAWGDADGDGLVNIYEFWSDTNPRAESTDQDGQLDVNEDRDGDGVANLVEQQLGSRPDIVDTDDDALDDNQERMAGSNPADANDPPVSRSLVCGGAATDYMEIPISIRQRMTDWMIESWVKPDSVTGGVGIIVRRVVQNLGGGTNALNYVLGVETNGSGQLQVYGGYVLTDGREFFVRGGTLTTGVWSYAAVSFDSLTSALLLYTNGVLAVSSNAQFSTPPINGKGGETFVRIGEHFQGQIDEVRLWDTLPAEEDILANYSNTVSELQTNLVHYFRFDDGQAVTNRLPFGPFHQPHNAQDFTYSRDWMNEWKHAGLFHGNVRFFAPGAVQPPASLRVNLLPPDAVTAGAQWSFNGGAYNNSGATLGNLPAGTNAVLYKSISGWTAPTNETIVLTNGAATTITRTYLQNGSLMVNIEPVSVGTGAQWRVDGAGAWLSSGVTATNLSPFSHSVEFKPVDGWLSPPTTNITIVGAATQVLTATYTDSRGLLEVFLSPNSAVLAGARWNLDGGGWMNTGTNLVLVASGSHQLSYQSIPGWVEPSNETVNIIAFVTTHLFRVYGGSDTDQDGLLDSWEVRWFGDLRYGAEDDPDRDGLKNIEEFNAAQIYAALDLLNPADFDSDDDGMDDKWEYDRYLAGAGLDPCVDDAMQDRDGDGLVNVQEYNGMDGWPRLMQDPQAAVGIAASNLVSTDDLNPLNYDTDSDHLVDSFEAAWYDAAVGIDPLTTGALFSADSDEDGMSSYREQCLLVEFREGESNDIWSHGTNDLPGIDTNGIYAFSPPLLLGATNFVTIIGDLAALRGQEWTDPVAGDTDEDLLPDGWEVEFNLDPKSAVGANGFRGDPDLDGLLNSQEFLGQDGDRSTNRPNVNGTGDETNPNQHNWRPVTTGPGPGIMRPAVDIDYWYLNDASPTNGTLGAALPTASLGFDRGRDTDDDGLSDDAEIHLEYSGLGIDPSPVHSMSPFIKRSAMINRASGVEIPDPEGSPFNYSPLLHHRNWTIECCVKLLGTNLTGFLIDNPGPLGVGDISYRLSLTNNAPIVSFHTLGGYCYKVMGPVLPTNQWIHLAGVWDHGNNSLDLYIDGVYFEAQRITEEAISSRTYASVTPPVIGASANGSFTNRLLMDEIRIWGVARTATEIDQYRRKLVPQDSFGLLAYYRFDDGGTTAEDFSRKAQNGLLGVDSTNYFFGDFGYALRTNGFAFVTNDYARVLGVDIRGADDADGDGMPDDWETVNHLDPLNAATNGATADADGDGLWNIYEYWSDTNPHSPDSDQDGVLDINEDRDGDGVADLMEQRLGSRPDMVDTDDDGLSDDVEQVNRTSPADASDPQIGRAMAFGGAADDFLEIPTLFSQRLTDWSLEAWVNPSNAIDGVGTIIRRIVQRIGPSAFAVNYQIGLENDGAGGLRLYAGYVTPNGSNYMIRTMTNSIPAGRWTHIAATYNWNKSTLILYTNGAIAYREDPLSATNSLVPAMVTNFFIPPPLNGKGGECFVRVGEDFAGWIDEVRIWNDTRGPDEVVQNLYSYFDPDAQGLIHNFNFDDSQANTNTFPFGQFHQPFGAQDIIYPKDWTNQWIHAAVLRGNLQFTTNTAVVPPPAISVILQPQGAVDAGAQWSLDSGAWHNSGDTVQNLDRVSLTHTILFKGVDGWSAPVTETVTVSNGAATSLTRYYVRRGSLTVFIQPPEAINTALAVDTDDHLWSIGNYGEGFVKGGLTYHRSGDTITNLDVSTYTLRFWPVTGWNQPASVSVDITEGSHVTQVGQYTKVVASLTVGIQPSEAIADGASWRVDSASWMPDGATTNLDYGPHTVEFLPIPPWLTPMPQTITVSNNASLVATGIYTEVSGVYVQIQPVEAVTNGAGWRLVGETNYWSSGTLRPLGVGSYTIEFRPLTGWMSPGNVVMNIQTGKTEMLTVTYLRSQVLFTNLVGYLSKPRGLALDSGRRKLYVVDSYNHRIVVYDTLTGSVTNWGGPTSGSGLGQFYQPQAVAVDPNTNVFVADTHNNRVQRRSSTSGTWTEWTGINSPWDVTLDWQTNLYVAEYYSNRVLKVTPAGVRSTFASNGFADGLVRSPGGVTVDAYNNIVISDFPNSQGRIQRFNTNGAFMNRLGSYLDAEGGLGKPQNLQYAGCKGVLFVSDIGTNSSNSLLQRNSDGTWQMIISEGTVPTVAGLAWDPAVGYLYVSDIDGNRVLRLSLPTLADLPPSFSLNLATNGMVATWGGVANWFYTVQYAESLIDPWINLPGAVDMKAAYSFRFMSCIDTNYLIFPSRIYRMDNVHQ